MKIYAILAGLVAVLGSFWRIISLATQREKLKGKVADHERAADIRDRVDNVDDRVRKHDGDGWRDE